MPARRELALPELEKSLLVASTTRSLRNPGAGFPEETGLQDGLPAGRGPGWAIRLTLAAYSLTLGSAEAGGS